MAAVNTVRYYKLTKCRLTYNRSIGQIRVNWNETEKETEIDAKLYLDGIFIAAESISGMSWDVTELISQTGVLTVEAYPVKLGPDYTIDSNQLTVTEEMLENIRLYDPWPYEPSYGEIRLDTEKGKITGFWEFNEKTSAGVVKLYRGETAVDSWRSHSDNTCDFTDIIAKKGTGTYKFKIYPSRLGDSHAVFSNEFEVDSVILKGLKASVTEEKKAEEAKRTGWYKEGQTNIWKYYKTPGVPAKREWLEYKGSTYHFSSNGIMQIGWQVIDDKYYFFDSSGALVKNGLTPDGFRVNQNGEYIGENGNVISANGEKEAPATPEILYNCTISVAESAKAGPGILRSVSFKETNGFKIDKISISVPYENWTAGTAVTVKIEVSTTTNCSFASGVSFSVRGCKNISSSGNSRKRTVLFSYIPKMQLTAPDHFYVTSQGYLCWKKAEKASRYKVVYTVQDENPITVQVNTNSCDLDSYVNINGEAQVSVKIYAMGSTANSSYLLTSAAACIDDLKAFRDINYVEGTLKWTSAGFQYTDDNGDKVTGWKKLFGNWYCFKKSGYAAGPGWYQDTDQLWYYFDNEYRMCTGKVNDGNAEYFLNDGTVTNLPIGAWVKDRR